MHESVGECDGRQLFVERSFSRSGNDVVGWFNQAGCDATPAGAAIEAATPSAQMPCARYNGGDSDSNVGCMHGRVDGRWGWRRISLASVGWFSRNLPITIHGYDSSGIKTRSNESNKSNTNKAITMRLLQWCG